MGARVELELVGCQAVKGYFPFVWPAERAVTRHGFSDRQDASGGGIQFRRVLEQIGVINKIIMDSGTDIWGQKKGNACNGILVSGGIRS